MDIRTKLCYYDTRNPDSVGLTDEQITEGDIELVMFIHHCNRQDAIKTLRQIDEVGPYKKPDCSCDNCYYGRTQLAEYALMLEEQLPFSN